MPDRAMVPRQPRGPEPLAAVMDREPPIQVSVDVDARPRVAATAGAGMELQGVRAELERVVVADDAPVLEAADALKVGRGWGRPPRRLGMRRWVREARIIAREKPIEHALGRGQRAGVREAQFGNEAILEGPKEALDAPFALGRGGGDPADPEFLEGPADLCRGHGPLQFFGQAAWSAGIAMKQAMAISVGGGGHAIAPDEAAKQEEVALRIFLWAKDAGEDLPRGIVNGGVEDEVRAPVLEPGMVAAIHLDEQAGLGHALAATPMAGWPADTRTADARGPQPALDRWPRQAHLLALGDELSEVAIVAAGIGGAREGEEPLAHCFWQPPRRGPAAVAMRERSQAVLADLGQQATEMADREAQESCRVRHHEASLEDLDQYVRSLLFPPAQRESPPVHGPRVTESLSSWGVTFSLSNYTRARRR